MLTAETLQEINKLASDMSNLFSPPELIPGCEVMDVTDIDLYDVNNGWIEAVCGKHNQQRCRWKGRGAAVEVGDYIDVLYFKSIRLFEVLGVGGTGAIPTVGNVWPRAGECGISENQYITWALMIAALAANQQGIIGEGTFVTNWTGGERLADDADLIGCGMDVSILTDSDLVILQPNGESTLQDFSIINTITTGGYGLYCGAGADILAINVSSINNSLTSGTYRCFYFYNAAGILIDCWAEVSGGDTNQAIYAYNSIVMIFGGYYDGDLYADNSTTTIIYLYGPVITGTITAVNGAVITGSYYNANGDFIQLDGNDVYPGNDDAGLFERFNRWQAFVYHFNTSADLTNFTWDAVNFSGTPNNINYTFNSVIRVWDTNAGTDFFAYRTLTSTGAVTIQALCSILSLGASYAYGGIRFDNPSAPTTNFFEVRVVPGSTAGTVRLQFRYDNGGGVTSAYYVDTVKNGWFLLQLTYNDASNYGLLYYGTDTPYPSYLANAVPTWSTATIRAGIICGQVGASGGNLGIAAIFDLWAE